MYIHEMGRGYEHIIPKQNRMVRESGISSKRTVGTMILAGGLAFGPCTASPCYTVNAWTNK